MIPRILRSWILAALGLLLASAGLRSLLVTGSVTSVTRSGVAAAILSAYAAAVALLALPRAGRSRGLCLVAGGFVPALLLVLTAVVVAPGFGLAAALGAAAPWATGLVLAWTLGPLLPGVRLPQLRRREP